MDIPTPRNPWSREHWDRIAQRKIGLVNLDDARRLAREAGSSLHATEPPLPTPAIEEMNHGR